MKRVLSIILFALLISCAPIPTPEIPLIPTTTAIPVTFTSTSTVAVPASPTVTPIMCDPFTMDFCITDGHFLFQRPIQPPGNTSVDVTYLYASTANGKREPHHGVEFLNKF